MKLRTISIPLSGRKNHGEGERAEGDFPSWQLWSCLPGTHHWRARLRPQLVGRHDVDVGWEHPGTSWSELASFSPKKIWKDIPDSSFRSRGDTSKAKTQKRQHCGSAQSTFLASSPCNQGEINAGWNTELQRPTSAAVSKYWVT